MNHPLKLRFLALLSVLYFVASPANPQSLDLRWKKDFPKPVSWYVRTSPGILLIKAGKSLTAVDGVDGRQLWVLPDVESSGATLGDLSEVSQRGRNLLEVPEMGVLLLNRVKLPGDSDGRLIALNLVTGERLWDEPQLDDLMTAVPLHAARQIVLVSRRLQRDAIAGGVMIRLVVPMGPFYPFRYEFQRLDPVTGKIQWNAEYPRIFNPSSESLNVIGDHLFVYVGNGILGSVDLANGHRVWEEDSKLLNIGGLPLPLEMADDRLIYGSKKVQAIDPATKQVSWEFDELGKITGISVQDDLVVAIGPKSVAAVDARTGTERWRKKTHAHTTNIVWDKQSDAIVYVDGKGLHSAERTTGKSLLDAPLHALSQPYHIRLASPEVVVTIATDEVCAYSFRTGKKLFAEGKLTGFFRSYALLDRWPMPEDGQNLIPTTRRPSGTTDWNSIREGTLLSAALLNRLQGYPAATEALLDAYETESKPGVPKIWWIDPEINRQIEFNVSGTHHDVSRSLGMIFVVHGNQVWGATFTVK